MPRCNRHLAVAFTFALSSLAGVELQAAPGDLDLVTAGITGEAVGGNATDFFQGVSGDGRYVLFRSASDAVVPGAANGRVDLFVRDRQSGRAMQVNVSTAGIPANAGFGFASVSDDGRYVVFDSNATNLVPNDTNGRSDVFLRDLAAGTTTRVSVSSTGVPGNRGSAMPSISADGRYVAFSSDATNFTQNVQSGLFVRDRLTGQTTYLRGTAYGSCGWPRISGDGRYVAFECSWQNPDWPGGYGKRNGYLFERSTDRVYTVVLGSIYNTRITDLSHDGRYVAFHTQQPLIPGDTNRMWDAYLWDRTTERVERVSVSLRDRQANLHSYQPTLSRDARYVAFESWAGDLVPDDPNGQIADVFVRDRRLGATERVSVGTDASFYPELSGDGRLVTFAAHGRLLPADTSDEPQDVYARELGAHVFAAPANLGFGHIAVGSTSAARPVTFTNDGTYGLAISWIGPTGADRTQFQVVRQCPGVLRPGQSCTVDVTFAPTSPGPQTALLVVTTGQDGGAGTAISVPLNGVGD